MATFQVSPTSTHTYVYGITGAQFKSENLTLHNVIQFLRPKMGRMCCIFGCKSNYRSQKNNSDEPDYVSVYKFPVNEAERQSWIHNIPNASIPKGKQTVVCRKHWPDDVEFVTIPGGHKRPVGPPTVFPNVPQSQTPTPVPPPRPTKRSSAASRNVKPDEYKQFKEIEKVNFCEIMKKLEKAIKPYTVNAYTHEGVIYLQSWDLLTHGVFKYLVKIYPDLKYEAFYGGPICIIKTLTCRNVSELKEWNQIIEVLRYLEHYEVPPKLKIHLEDVGSLSRIQKVGVKVYDSATMVRAFDIFATSRAAYQRLLSQYQLPSVTTLTRLTSKACAISDFDFIQKIFQTLEGRQKQCIILVDEIKVKPSLLYHGGKLFGSAHNKPDELANAVLAVMVVCMYGGPKFLAKMIPVKKSDGQFQFTIVKSVIKAVTHTDGTVVSIISDNHRINQNLMSKFNTSKSEPWLTQPSEDIPGMIFLLYDFVHLFKSVRNNWFTENCQEIEFKPPTESTTFTAKWVDIVTLFNLNRDMSHNHAIRPAHHLTYPSVFPKPIERQNVPLMLKIFSDETLACLKTYLDDSAVGTIKFVELWIHIWKILNVKKPFTNIRLRDPSRSEIRDDESSKELIKSLRDVANMVELMPAKNGKFIFLFYNTIAKFSTSSVQKLEQDFFCSTIMSNGHVIRLADG